MFDKSFFEVFFDLERQSVLEKSRNFLSIVTVAVTHWEKVTVAQVEHVGISQVGILVHFVRVVRRDTALCGKGKLSDYIVYRWWVTFFLVWWCCCLSCSWLSFITFLLFWRGPGLWFMSFARGRFTSRIRSICNVRQWSSDQRPTLLRPSVPCNWSSLARRCTLSALTLGSLCRLGGVSCATCRTICICWLL